MDNPFDGAITWRSGPLLFSGKTYHLPVNSRNASSWFLQCQTFNQLLKLGRNSSSLPLIFSWGPNQPREANSAILMDPASQGSYRKLVMGGDLGEWNAIFEKWTDEMKVLQGLFP